MCEDDGMPWKPVDVEVYVQTGDWAAVVAALQPELGGLTAEHVPELSLHIYSNQIVHAMITERDDGFVSVWLKTRGPWRTGAAPWRNSPALARVLVQRLRCVVCCDPEDDYPEVSPLSYTFLQIDADGAEALFSWLD